jgi:hypothetical protein
MAPRQAGASQFSKAISDWREALLETALIPLRRRSLSPFNEYGISIPSRRVSRASWSWPAMVTPGLILLVI